jgi:hypothetical protein
MGVDRKPRAWYGGGSGYRSGISGCGEDIKGEEITKSHQDDLGTKQLPCATAFFSLLPAAYHNIFIKEEGDFLL